MHVSHVTMGDSGDTEGGWAEALTVPFLGRGWELVSAPLCEQGLWGQLWPNLGTTHACFLAVSSRIQS